MSNSDPIIIPRETEVFSKLERLIDQSKVICFSGLPGVGKSLYVQQLCYLGVAKGRSITTMQWDIVRQNFEIGDVMKKYPEIDGVTHAGLRKACGLWAREAVVKWYEKYAHSNDVLIIEAPLIGNRLVELVQRKSDDFESVLSGDDFSFVVPIPSEKVRKEIVAQREATSANPKHQHEKADAMPHVMRMLYEEVCQAAEQFGKKQDEKDYHRYDPEIYEYVFDKVLTNRHFIPLHINEVYDAKEHSVYEFSQVYDKSILAPSREEVDRMMKMTDEKFSDEVLLNKEVNNWFIV